MCEATNSDSPQGVFDKLIIIRNKRVQVRVEDVKRPLSDVASKYGRLFKKILLDRGYGSGQSIFADIVGDLFDNLLNLPLQITPLRFRSFARLYSPLRYSTLCLQKQAFVVLGL